MVARLGPQAITVADVDEALKLPLYDLERARYELRLERIRQLLTGRVFGGAASAAGQSIDAYVRAQAGDDPTAQAQFVATALDDAQAKIMLPEPEPPLMAVATDGAPQRGPADAAATIVEFLDFQSPYCATMQPLLRRLLDEYPRHLRLVVRDFPLPMHRDGPAAAEAARCAGTGEIYWLFHDALLQQSGDLSRPSLVACADRLGIARDAFVACLNDGTMRSAVMADVTIARGLGVTVAPTFFVNGRYLKGPQSYAALRARIETELTRLGIDPASARVVPTSTTSTTIAPTVTTLAASPPSTTAPARDPDPEAVTTPQSSVTLRAPMVREALRQRRRLARDLDLPTGPGLDGRRFVRIENARTGGLFDAMGLESGDLLFSVDEQPLFNSGDRLFDALRDHATVRLRIIRRGLVHDFEYRIE